jgi:hypothetical protein
MEILSRQLGRGVQSLWTSNTELVVNAQEGEGRQVREEPSAKGGKHRKSHMHTVLPGQYVLCLREGQEDIGGMT